MAGNNPISALLLVIITIFSQSNTILRSSSSNPRFMTDETRLCSTSNWRFFDCRMRRGPFYQHLPYNPGVSRFTAMSYFHHLDARVC